MTTAFAAALAAGSAGSTPTIVGTLALGHQAPVLCTDRALAKAFVPNFAERTVSVVDLGTGSVVASLPVGRTPVDVLPDGNTGDVYVVNQGSDSVTTIDASKEVVIGSFTVGDAPPRIYESGARLLVLNGNGGDRDTLTIATKQGTIPETEIETRVLRDGLFGDDWQRTFEFWRVWTAPGPGREPVCRLFSERYAPRSSHFYTMIASECAERAAGAVWQLESTAAYYLALTDAFGNCAAGTAPLYRVYNRSMSGAPNHRLTASRAVRDRMVAQGWEAEGNGVDVIFACTPTLAVP